MSKQEQIAIEVRAIMKEQDCTQGRAILIRKAQQARQRELEDRIKLLDSRDCFAELCKQKGWEWGGVMPPRRTVTWYREDGVWKSRGGGRPEWINSYGT